MDEDLGGTVAKVLRNSCSVVRVSPGQPIGFRGTSKWLELVCGDLGVDPSPALEAVRKEERRCALLLARHSSLTGLPKGATFSLQARPSVALGLLEFLHGYLGMVPVCVDCHDKAPAVERYLREHGLEDALGTSLFRQPCQLMLGDGNAVSMGRSALGAPGIEIGPPYQSGVRIRRTTLWGHVGAVDLLDEILLKLGDRW
jgi:nitrogenase molybdenum-iron protein alpha/beta subunit